MKLLTSVSVLVKLAVVCFLIGFGSGFWLAGKALPEVAWSSITGEESSEAPRAWSVMTITVDDVRRLLESGAALSKLGG